jgi:hypothetical protein
MHERIGVREMEAPMKVAWRHGGALLVVLLAMAIAPGLATAETTSRDAGSAAEDLASRLSVSPPTSTWLADASKESSFQADVNRMAYLAAHLAAELERGKQRDATLGLYRELRSVGIRILRRSRATGEQLPAADVAAYEQLMAKLEDFYGPVQ